MENHSEGEIVAIVVRCECGNEFQPRDEDARRPALCPVCQRALIRAQPKLALDANLADFHDVRAPRTSSKAIASLSLGLCPFVASLITGQPAIFVPGLVPHRRTRDHPWNAGIA